MTDFEKQRAKEKAEELVYKFIEKDLVKTDYFDDELWLEVYSSDVQFQNAKQCALIGVQEIINANPHSNPFNTEIYSTMDYWLQVKKEIEEMK